MARTEATATDKPDRAKLAVGFPRKASSPRGTFEILGNTMRPASLRRWILTSFVPGPGHPLPRSPRVWQETDENGVPRMRNHWLAVLIALGFIVLVLLLLSLMGH